MKGLIFTWLLTLLGVSAAVIRPYYGFLVYVALAILRPDALWSSHISGGRFSMIVASAMLLSWAFRCGGNWDLGPARRIVSLFLGYWLWSVFLAFNADSPAHAWYYVEQQAKIVLPFIVGLTTVQNSADLRRLAWVIVVCQGYVAMELNRWYFSGYNYLWIEGFGGLDNNSMAIGLVTALGVAFFLFFYEKETYRKAIIAACAAFIGHAILFSFSRGAMLATVVFAGVSFFIIRKTTVHYCVFGAGMLIAIVLAGPQVRDRFLQTFAQDNGVREASAQSRLDLWRDCATLLARDPIMGCGPDHWPLHAESFGWTPLKEAHSLWVQTAVELGIPGILLYAGFYLTVLACCWKLLKQTRDDEDEWFADSARMTIASLVGFIVAAQFVSLEALEIPYYVALLGTATLSVHYRTVKQAAQSVLTAELDVAFVPADTTDGALPFGFSEPEYTLPQSPDPIRWMNVPQEITPEIRHTDESEPVVVSDWRDRIESESESEPRLILN